MIFGFLFCGFSYLINYGLSLSIITYIVDSKDLENGSDSAYKAKAGTAHFLIELEKRRSIKVSDYASLKFSQSISKL
jgi:hypothetical protein